jgi:hypothetical protein
MDAHLIADRNWTHNHARVRAWLASRPQLHLHHTSTYVLLLSHVERWFGLIIQEAARRGLFNSVFDLKRKHNEFVARHNQHSRHFAWTATADAIQARIEQLRKVIAGR